ncbi:hypothetical protein AUG19_09550 [archaeon 13_1_20CM_2_54_9]|nr:MAG: hypothetical protein AUJ07_02210 [Crenarchaeota archaeon 13_1_40CM_3_53_5]OLE74158.1 MAG: hypothetical protein AUG19_09550 [archaeon 13_1_20CM_2_54_9]TMI30617.1 MAG: hypothetical protein E6H29_07685 [Candidatus Bathyarchaeota archaeon]
MAQGKPPGGGSVTVRFVLSLILAFIGLFSLLALLTGYDFIQQRRLDDAGTSLYLSLAFVTFLFVVFNIVRTRRGFSLTTVVPSKVLSVVQCTQCSFKQLKNFALGDYVTKAEGKCTQCGNQTLFVSGIFTEAGKKR